MATYTSLAHSPADILRRVMIAVGIGTAPEAVDAWPVYAAGEPDVPDNVLTVYDTAGVQDSRSMIGGELSTHYGVQIRIRSKTHPVGWARADLVRHSLARGIYQAQVTIDTVTYLVHAVVGIGTVIPLGKDGSNTKRSLFTLNAMVVIHTVT